MHVVGGGEGGVGMQEDEDVARCVPRAHVALMRTPARGHDDSGAGVTCLDSFQGLRFLRV